MGECITDLTISAIENLHRCIRSCRLCLEAGYLNSAELTPIANGKAPAPFMVIGQAPSISDLKNEQMYSGPAGRKLIAWLIEAGFQEREMNDTVYLTAITKCFPGRLPGKSTDRAPSRREQQLCRKWLDAQMNLVSPSVVILFGKMAIDTYLPKTQLSECIGSIYHINGRAFIPLPHSSGASTWLNKAEHQALLKQAINLIREYRNEIKNK